MATDVIEITATVAKFLAAVERQDKAIKKLTDRMRRATDQSVKGESKSQAAIKKTQQALLANVAAVRRGEAKKAAAVRATSLRMLEAQAAQKRGAFFVGQEMRNTNAIQKETFGGVAVARLATFAASFVGITAVIGVTIRAIKKLDTIQKTSAEKVRTAAQEEGRLATVTGPDKVQTLPQAIAEANKSFATGAFESRAAALRLQFELISGGLTEERTEFARLQLIGDSAAMALRASTLRKAFGVEGAGRGIDIASQAFAAAGPVPGVEPAGMMEAVTSMAVPAKQAGFSLPQTMALASGLAQETGDAPEAATMGRQLLISMAKRGITMGAGGVNEFIRSAEEQSAFLEPLKDPEIERLLISETARGGRGAIKKRISKLSKQEFNVEERLDELFETDPVLAERILELQDRKRAATPLQKAQFLGRQRAQIGLGIVSGMELNVRRAGIEEAVGAGLAQQRVGAALREPGILSTKIQQASAAEKELELIPQGVIRNIAEAVINDIFTNLEREGANRGLNLISNASLRAQLGIGAMSQGGQLATIAQFGTPEQQEVALMLAEKMGESSHAQDRLRESIDRNTEVREQAGLGRLDLQNAAVEVQ